MRAANAEKEAKESLRLAQNARKEAEKKALEAVKESERIDEEMKLRLSQLKNKLEHIGTGQTYNPDIGN